MSKKGKIVSVNYVKREFSTIGLILCLYIILVLFLPSIIDTYFKVNPSLNHIVTNEYLYVGITYLLFVIGTLVPTLTLFLSSKVKVKEVWRKSSIKFSDIIVSTIVFLALGTASMFLMLVINSYLPLGEEVISPIGLAMQANYRFNPLYIFLFVIVSPILEEFAFRGVLLRSLGRYGNRFALWATALFYALSHATFAEMFPAFVMSLFLTKMTLRYRSIQPTILVHIFFNAVLYGFTCIPAQYYVVMALILFLLYFLTIIFLFTKRYRYVKIKRQNQSQVIWYMFLTRPSVIISILLVILHSIIITLL